MDSADPTAPEPEKGGPPPLILRALWWPRETRSLSLPCAGNRGMPQAIQLVISAISLTHNLVMNHVISPLSPINYATSGHSNWPFIGGHHEFYESLHSCDRWPALWCWEPQLVHGGLVRFTGQAGERMDFPWQFTEKTEPPSRTKLISRPPVAALWLSQDSDQTSRASPATRSLITLWSPNRSEMFGFCESLPHLYLRQRTGTKSWPQGGWLYMVRG